MAVTLAPSRASGAASHARLPLLTPAHAQSRASGRLTSLQKSNSDLNTEEAESKDFARVDDNVRIEEQINLKHLQQLKVLFQEHKIEDSASDDGDGVEWWRAGEDQHEREAGELTRQEFKDALSQVLGTHAFDHQLDVLFSKLDTSDDGFVDWDEFCTYMLLQLRENDFLASRTQRPFQSEAKIRHIVYNKQETTTRILAMDCPLRFITVSKEGAICFWHPSLNIERHTIMSVREGEGRGGSKRRVKTWVTDAVYMSNCRKLAICTTGRDIRFYDIASQNCDEQFQLFGLSDVPCCMYYYCDVKARNVTAESTLIYGDDSGALNVLQFHNPGTQLFNAPFKKEQGVQQVFMQELAHHHTKWVHHTVVENVHPEPVQKVFYMADNATAMSSCKGPKNSLVITDIARNRKAYVFNILKGVECFDYCKNLNTVATGSADHIVRLWNPYVPRRPVAVLEGHAVSIVDVVIHESIGLLLSYSKDAMIRVWDLKEHVCIQITTVKFPCTLNGRFAEHGPFALHLQSERPTNGLLVGAGDYIAMLRMGEGNVAASTTPTTHLTQLCAAIYNPYFKQVITGADDSSIGMWDVNTGMKALMFTKCHGNEEITSLDFDATYKKLVTGARDGSVKVWNVQNGHNIHKLAPVSEAEVTGVLMITERDTVLSVGWNRLISTYDISQKENVNVDADIQWKGGQLHKEDILALAYLHPTLIATASFDGEIYVWSLETEKVYIQLRRAKRIFNIKPTTPAPDATSSTPMPSRPNSRHRTKQKQDQNQPVPVDKLLFLPTRAQVKRTEDALLISSEGGVLHWWSLYRKIPKAGEFYAPHQPDDTVLGLCTDPDNAILITGDSVGQMSVWDIQNYCVGSNTELMNPPPLRHTWHAHETCIVSVDYVNHDVCGAFVVSASTDKTAKLWTTDGHCVGVFGQRSTWDLRDPKTWAEPREETVKITTEDAEDVSLEIDIPSDNEAEDNRSETGSVNKLGLTVRSARSDLGDTSARESKSPRPQLLITESGENRMAAPSPARSLMVGPLNPIISRENTEMSVRTMATPAGHENMLGYKAEAHLIKRQQDRVERRDQYGELAPSRTSRMGNLCCPFAALTMQNLSECVIPKDLPVTSRMISKGYSPSSMTQEKLTSMNLSLFQSGDGIDVGDSYDSKHSPRGNGTGNPKGRRYSVGKLPDIKKNNRVMVKR